MDHIARMYRPVVEGILISINNKQRPREKIHGVFLYMITDKFRNL